MAEQPPDTSSPPSTSTVNNPADTDTTTPPSFPIIKCKCGSIPNIQLEDNNKITFTCSCSAEKTTFPIKDYLSHLHQSTSHYQHNTTCTWTQQHFITQTKGVDYCSLCQKWLCADCIKIHNQFDSLLNQELGIQPDESDLKCCVHSKDITFSYCVTCKEDFCEKTDKTHLDDKHNIIRLKDLRNKNQVRNISTNLNDAKEFVMKVEETKNALINELESKINEIKNNYDKWKTNFESYLTAIELIYNEYTCNTNSFQSIMNLINNSLFIELKQTTIPTEIINVDNYNKTISFLASAKVLRNTPLDLSKYINRFSEITIWKDLDNTKLPKAKDEETKNDIALIDKNVEILTKLTMHNISQIRDYTQNHHFDNLASFKLFNCQIKNIDFQNTFPSLNKILFKKCLSFDLDTLRTMTLNLQVIAFEKCNLITNEFTQIMTILMKSENIRKNIQSISFAKNYITIVDLNQYIYQNKQTPQLTEIDFSKNKIYKFLFTPEYAPKIAVINISYNNLSKAQFYNFKKEKTVIIANNNIYLSGNKERNEYLKTLLYQLKTFTFKVPNLSFSCLYNKHNKHELNDVIINPKIITSIKKLNLSSCSLDNETLFKFILNNKANFPELHVLNLNNNYINDEFFKLYKKHNLHLFFPKLSHVYLNGNDIKGSNFNDIGLFIQDNKRLTRIYLCKNPFNKEYSATNIGKSGERGSGGKNLFVDGDSCRDSLKAKMKNGEEVEVNDFVGLLALVKFYDSEEGKKIRNENKNEKGFVMKFDLYKRFNFDNGATYSKYKIEKKVEKVRNK